MEGMDRSVGEQIFTKYFDELKIEVTQLVSEQIPIEEFVYRIHKLIKKEIRRESFIDSFTINLITIEIATNLMSNVGKLVIKALTSEKSTKH